MAFNYSTSFGEVLTLINDTYPNWKEEYFNKVFVRRQEDQHFIEDVYAPISEAVVDYLYANHSDKKVLEFDMKEGLIKFFNNDKGCNLSISSACWRREWYSFDLSGASNIEDTGKYGDDYRGLFYIKIREKFNVRPDCVLRLPSMGGLPNWNNLTCEVSPTDNTKINFDDYDILMVNNPCNAVDFTDLVNWKTALNYSGSLLFYNVTLSNEIAAEDREFQESVVDLDPTSLSFNKKYTELITDNPQFNSKKGQELDQLPEGHAVLDFAGTTGFYVP